MDALLYSAHRKPRRAGQIRCRSNPVFDLADQVESGSSCKALLANLSQNRLLFMSSRLTVSFVIRTVRIPTVSAWLISFSCHTSFLDRFFVLPRQGAQKQNNEKAPSFLSNVITKHQALFWWGRFERICSSLVHRLDWGGQSLWMDDTVVRIKLLKYGVKLDLVYGVGLLEHIYVESFDATRWASQDEGCE